MVMSTLRKGALNDACRVVAMNVCPGAQNDVIETMSHRFQEAALFHEQFIVEQGRDPNMLTKAVLYLANAHAIPPMHTEITWFENMLDCLVELAVPNSQCGEDAIAFLAEVESGINESRSN
jgi:hypothetical protein